MASSQHAMRGKAKGAAGDPVERGAAGSRSAARRASQKKKDGYGFAIGVLIALVALMCFALPTFIILFGGMAPTWVAFIVDDRRTPYRINAIAACNLAGVLPYIALLWSKGENLNYAMQILSDVFAWATMYMGAVAGMAALWIGPHIAAMIFNVQAVNQRRSLDGMRRALVEEWGTDVLPPPEKRGADKSEPAKVAKKTAPSGDSAAS